MTKIIGIYGIINQESKKAYIGQSIDVMNRLRSHKRHLKKGQHHCVYLQRAWNKHGFEQFTFKLLLVCAKEHLTLYEGLIFKAFDLYNSKLEAGTGNYVRKIGLKHSEEAKQKIRNSSKGRSKPMSKETAKKISVAVRKARKVKPVILSNGAGTNLKFESMKDVSEHLGVSLQSVWNTLNGRQRHLKGWKAEFI